MRWTAEQIPDLTGRRALVTGANSGIGAVEARELARHGADVVLAVRNTDAGEAAAERIRATGVPGILSVERLDLASQESVRDLAARFEGPLDLLVNNAGVMAPPKHRETGDGFEMQFGTNHLGHFALTGLLLPHLLEAAAPRVTTVS
jgi:NAD(P)-dependent dehydrogenase (short-subunit alcohol dehydrogenase family)